jgi:hypothetical protein
MQDWFQHDNLFVKPLAAVRARTDNRTARTNNRRQAAAPQAAPQAVAATQAAQAAAVKVSTRKDRANTRRMTDLNIAHLHIPRGVLDAAVRRAKSRRPGLQYWDYRQIAVQDILKERAERSGLGADMLYAVADASANPPAATARETAREIQRRARREAYINPGPELQLRRRKTDMNIAHYGINHGVLMKAFTAASKRQPGLWYNNYREMAVKDILKQRAERSGLGAGMLHLVTDPAGAVPAPQRRRRKRRRARASLGLGF